MFLLLISAIASLVAYFVIKHVVRKKHIALTHSEANTAQVVVISECLLLLSIVAHLAFLAFAFYKPDSLVYMSSLPIVGLIISPIFIAPGIFGIIGIISSIIFINHWLKRERAE